MRSLFGLCATIGIGFLLYGCQSAPTFSDTRGDSLTPWTHKQFNNNPRNFQFAIVADRNGGMRPGVFETAIEKLNMLQPEFVICVGDLVAGYTEDVTELNQQWDEFETIVGNLEMPFCHVPGNHDLPNNVMLDKWQKQFGLPYYHFVYNDVLFLCLDTEDPPSPHISDEQAAYIEKAIADAGDVRWTFVFMHVPMWHHEFPDSDWPKIGKSLEGRPHTVFSGHFHQYRRTMVNGNKYFVLAATGGHADPARAKIDQFDHVVWVTMTDDGPRIANLMLDGIVKDDVVTEEIAPQKDVLVK